MTAPDAESSSRDDPKKTKEVSLAVSADVEQLEDPSASNVARRLSLLLSHVRPSTAHPDSAPKPKSAKASAVTVRPTYLLA